MKSYTARGTQLLSFSSKVGRRVRPSCFNYVEWMQIQTSLRAIGELQKADYGQCTARVALANVSLSLPDSERVGQGGHVQIMYLEHTAKQKLRASKYRIEHWKG